MADLKFADYEREWIAKNKVDTAFRTHTYLKYTIDGSLAKPRAEVYDANGNRIYINNGPFSGYIKTQYDSNNLKKKITYGSCVTTNDSICYRFVPDSLLLYEIWYNNYKKPDSIVAGYYLFDTLGRIIESNIPMPEFHFTQSKLTYHYSQSGRLVLIEGTVVSNRGTTIAGKYHKQIFYSTNNKPDSAIASFPYYGVQNYVIKTYYDSLGLRYKTIDWDTLVTTYKYTFRK